MVRFALDLNVSLAAKVAVWIGVTSPVVLPSFVTSPAVAVRLLLRVRRVEAEPGERFHCRLILPASSVEEE